MPNELLWLIFIAFDLSAVLILYRYFGRIGLVGAIVTGTIISNVQVLKGIELLGLDATLGNVTYAGLFLATDLLSERYGKRAALQGVGMGFASLLVFTVSMQWALWMTPSAADTAHEPMAALFGLLPRVTAASLLAYLVSQTLDVYLFHAIRARTGAARLWLRNNGSTWISQAVDSLAFVLVAFSGVLPWAVVWEIALSTYVIKLLVAAADTVFIYRAVRLRPRDDWGARAVNAEATKANDTGAAGRNPGPK